MDLLKRNIKKQPKDVETPAQPLTEGKKLAAQNAMTPIQEALWLARRGRRRSSTNWSGSQGSLETWRQSLSNIAIDDGEVVRDGDDYQEHGRDLPRGHGRARHNSEISGPYSNPPSRCSSIDELDFGRPGYEQDATIRHMDSDDETLDTRNEDMAQTEKENQKKGTAAADTNEPVNRAGEINNNNDSENQLEEQWERENEEDVRKKHGNGELQPLLEENGNKDKDLAHPDQMDGCIGDLKMSSVAKLVMKKMKSTSSNPGFFRKLGATSSSSIDNILQASKEHPRDGIPSRRGSRENLENLDVVTKLGKLLREQERRRKDVQDGAFVLKAQPADSTPRELSQKIDQISAGLRGNPLVIHALATYNRTEDKGEFLCESIGCGPISEIQARVAALNLNGHSLKDLRYEIRGKKYQPLQYALLLSDEQAAIFLTEHSGEHLTKDVLEDGDDQVTPLQMALMEGSSEIIKSIVNSLGEQGRDTYINKPISIASYVDKPYGVLPLAIATWSCLRKSKKEEIGEILRCLVSHGADLQQKTEKGGNTLLHLLVLQASESNSDIEFFSDLLEGAYEEAAETWWESDPVLVHKYALLDRQKHMKNSRNDAIDYLLKIRNDNGLTPLGLAARIESPLYHSIVQWDGIMCTPDKHATQYSSRTVYNITDIVSIDKEGHYRDNSVMHVLAHNNVDLLERTRDVDIVDTEPMATLTKTKWTFYRWFFYAWGLFHLLYMGLFSYFTLEDIKMRSELTTAGSNNTTSINISINGTVVEDIYQPNIYFCVFLILPIIYLVFEIFDFSMAIWSFEVRYTITGNSLYRIMSCVFSICNISWFVLYMRGHVDQDVSLALSLLFGWSFGIFFTRTISFPSKTSQIGAFSIMMQRMLMHDLIPFGLTSFFLIISFSTAIQATLDFSASEEDDFNFKHTLYQMVKYFAALDDPMSEESSANKQFVKVLLCFYGITIVVLLINMLIAAMNKTFDIIRETKCNLVNRQRLSIMLLLERRLYFVRLWSHSQKNIEHVDEGMFILIDQKSILGQIGTGKKLLRQDQKA